MAMQATRKAPTQKAGDVGNAVASEPAFDFLSAEYVALFDASQATAFQGPEWLHVFYSKLVPALDIEPLIITLRDSKTGVLKLVLPLVRQKAMGAKLVQPADLGVSDYNSVVASPGTLEQLQSDAATRNEILKITKPFDALFFRKQREDGFCISKLFDSTVISPNENAAYDIEIGSGFDDWFANGVSKSFRKSFRSKQRKLENDHGELSFHCLTQTEEIDAALKFMRRVRAERFPDDLFCQDEYYAFYSDFAHLAVQRKRAFLHVSKVNGKTFAAEFGLVHDGASYLVHGAFDEAYAVYSPGHLSLVNLIKDLLEHEQTRFDFTIGDHEYKTRFNARKTELTNAVLSNSSLGTLVSAVYHHGGGVKKLLTKLNPQVN